MKAALLYGKGDVRIEDVPTPRPGPGQVLVKIEACGICGGDYHGFQKAKPRTEGAFFGHEVAGTIAEIGDQVDGAGDSIRVGDRIAVGPNTSCGSCGPCLRGMRFYCENKPQGLPVSGGFSQYKVVFPPQCFAIPDSLALPEATMAEPVACCLYAESRAGIVPGDRVAILGAGANALVFVQVAQIRGASSVVVVDTIESRLSVAESLGASRTVKSEFLPTAEDADAYDLVIVARGSPVFTEAAIQYCDIGGKVLCYGVSSGAASIDLHEVFRKRLTLVGSRSFDDTYGDAVDLISTGRIAVDDIVTSKVPIDDLASALGAPPDGHIKAVALPWAAGENDG